MKKPITFPRLRAQADPEHAGKHPFHDFRFVTTDHPLIYDTEANARFGDQGPRVRFEDEHDHPGSPAKIICTLADVMPDLDDELPTASNAGQKAFALLFAAAPDLLSALEAAVICFANSRWHARHGGDVPNSKEIEKCEVAARAAIAKAKGETL